MGSELQEKTLVVLCGNARGGEKTWHSMYSNLLDPYNADLALCFGYQEEKSSSLYSRAKYIWEIPEYEKWENYYIEHLGDNFPWKKSFRRGEFTGFSGLYNSVGSGAIYCAFLHYVYTYKKEILQTYDRIIMTRSDNFYVKRQPILSNEYFWIPSGEGYGGLNDRFHIFPSEDINLTIGIVSNYINSESFFENINESNINLEKTYVKYFEKTGYINKVRTFDRVQFLVKTELDGTRWGTYRWGFGKYLPYNDDLMIKYEEEFSESMKFLTEVEKFKVFNFYKTYGK